MLLTKLNYGYLEGITKSVVVPFIMHIISIKNIKIVLDNALLIHYNERVRRASRWQNQSRTHRG